MGARFMAAIIARYEPEFGQEFCLSESSNACHLRIRRTRDPSRLEGRSGRRGLVEVLIVQISNGPARVLI
jgi:hypothetical protein